MYENGEDDLIPEAHPDCLQWVKERVLYSLALEKEDAWSDEATNHATQFLVDNKVKRLFAQVDPEAGLITGIMQHTAGNPAPPDQAVLIIYFFKRDATEVVPENIDNAVHFGVMLNNGMDSFLRVMQHVYAPTLLRNRQWPESIQKDFSAQLHRFLAGLTENVNRMKGCTVLYVPQEDIEEAAQDKDRVQRFESALIHWTRQIKDVLNEKDNVESSENEGPLAEIEFWRARTEDLNNIRNQLERNDVKQIVEVLDEAKSTYYLEPFNKLASLIEEGSDEAIDNLKYLQTVQPACENLSVCSVKGIPVLLPEILRTMQMIFHNSKFYNTPERLVGMLRKISNEIIMRCSGQISLQAIFDGNVQASMVTLQESMAAGEEWKKVCKQMLTATARRWKEANGRPWEIDETSIFAEIDAFVQQRCKDLLEVCEGQIQFGGKAAGDPGSNESTVPCFGGTRGPEIAKSLVDIQKSFEKQVNMLRNLKYNILDVKSGTLWHGDFGVYKNGTKDLEVMMTNVISSAFEIQSTIESGVELLEAFSFLAKREQIRRTVQRKTVEIYVLFNAELNHIKKVFGDQKKEPPIQKFHPPFAGRAIWASNFRNRIEANQRLLELCYFLSESKEKEETNATYKGLHSALEHYILTTYNEWKDSVPDSLAPLLEINLISKIQAPTGVSLLECNFDIGLLTVFEEMRYFHRLGFMPPPAATEMLPKEERLRIFRENVCVVVRHYNHIVNLLSPDERRLFTERIAFLDKKFAPGLNKLFWSSKGIVEYFVRDCRKFSRGEQQTVDEFKESVSRIKGNCRLIADALLVHIQKKKTYSEAEFEQTQKEHREMARDKLKAAHHEIVVTMKRIYEFFMYDSQDIQREWKQFVERIEKDIDDALRTTVKRSLQEISKAIIGDVKGGEVGQLFLVNVVLETQRPELKPSILQLSQMINNVSKELITVISVVPRLEEALIEAIREEEEREAKESEEREKKSGKPNKDKPKPRIADNMGAVGDPADLRPSFYDMISNDHDILKVMVQIMTGMSSIQEEVTKYLYRWDKYNNIYQLDKDAFIRRFAKANRPLSQFDAEIQKYKDSQSLIQNEETTTTIKFIKVDCAPLKTALGAHCNEWQKKFFTLLNTMACTELDALYEMFASSMKKIKAAPTSLDMLGEQLNLVTKLQAEEGLTVAKFEPLQAQYALLEKYEVSIKEEEVERHANLPNAWEQFKTGIQDGQRKLNGWKEKFKIDLEQEIKSFDKSAAALLDEWRARGPYEADMGIEKAQGTIAEYRQKLAQKREKESSLRVGMDIFTIDKPPYKELQDLSGSLDQFETMWKLTEGWNQAWEQWKTNSFQDLKVEDMNVTMIQYRSDVNKLARDLKQFDVWAKLKDSVEQFKRTLPLLTDLKNEAMRERHWLQLMEEIEIKFDPYAQDFTMDKVAALRLDKYPEFIANLSISATQELNIERSLQKIRELWENTTLNIDAYRTEYFRILSTEDIFTQLEDNIVTLGNMKVSRFVEAFASEVNMWEVTLSLIADTVETLLMVQTKWMYLENIFVGSEDIQKKLPNEANLFNQINMNWNQIMTRMHNDPNVLRSTKKEGLLETLNDMLKKLERIQKQLDDYLEDRRRAFPRFYFLSNDDLLEILGHAREPTKVQPHLKKCFEAINLLELAENKKGGMYATKMISPEKEEVTFNQAVLVEGVAVELWLLRVEGMMKETLCRALFATYNSLKSTKKEGLERWIRDCKGQMQITAAQINWTFEVERVLTELGKGNLPAKKKPMKSLYKKWKVVIIKYTEMIRGKISRQDRSKLVSLVTIEVHARDILDKLQATKTESINDFLWTSQLRFYWDTVEDTCMIRQNHALIKYDYEYVGNSGRLVITPLTDRCYMTLTTALQLYRGGLPQGPAGTGKTETTKDLAKAIAKYVIVFNCSDGLDYQAMGRMFSGLAQTGSWSCFDEFNRIEVEVLSVVAQQISCILGAIQQRKEHFVFEGQDIPLNLGCGIFVTMNPGYAGRSELPDNLKALLRPVSMMVPDLTLICEISLLSQGFADSESLARKVTMLFELMDKQLSKQDHYDFTLRNIKAVMVFAGNLKKEAAPDVNEESVVLKACANMQLPKFVREDVPLFLDMLSDLFPSVEPEDGGNEDLIVAIKEDLAENRLQVLPYSINKCIQTHQTQETRHGVMLVGQTGAGKSTAWRTNQGAFKKLSDREIGEWVPARPYLMNPKSITMDELYGTYNLATREWHDGILSYIMRSVCSMDTKEKKWIVFDGPVDTLWIESMNTVLDDNKMLTLNSGERISMPPTVGILFEVQDLAVASPATVSRCGMVYYDYPDLGWEPYFLTWLESRREYERSINAPNPDQVCANIKLMYDTHVANALAHRKKECVELFPTHEINAVRSLTYLFDALATPENGLQTADAENYILHINMLWTFALVWSIGATVTQDSRRKFDMFAREVDPQFPSSDTVYEYWVDLKNHGWKSWEEKVPQTFKPEKDTPFYKLMVPTVDTVRNQYVVTVLARARRHILLVGVTGTGKTAVMQSIMQSLPEQQYSTLLINFSAQTTSKKVQDIIEGKMEKKSKKSYAPPGGKRLVCCIEDLNMPAKDLFFSQPTLELLRLWIDQGFWYDREKQSKRQINDMQLLGTMTSGRQMINPRIQSKFSVINITFPHDAQVKKIFSAILATKLDGIEEFRQMIDQLVQSTVEVYNSVVSEMLPTPSKSHYLFNLRDMSKVFQGVMQAKHDLMDTREQMIVLWMHECIRVFSDRLNDENDKNWFKDLISAKLGSIYNTKWNQLTKDGANPIVVDFLDPNEEDPQYAEVTNYAGLKKHIENKAVDYNEEPGYRAMDLVFFGDAMDHLCRIHRIIRQPRGNALLVGVGGSGRQSLTRMATYLANYTLFSIEVTKSYRSSDFHEDLKKLYLSCGKDKHRKTFLFSDTQIVEPSFLEDINGMLGSGEVANLFASDEIAAIREDLRADAIAEKIHDTLENVYQYFIDRARERLHIVVCMSPVGSAFRVRLRMFPTLVNNTSIDWFTEWPQEALKEVAMKFLTSLEDIEGGDEMKSNVADCFVVVHTSVGAASLRMKDDLRRSNYVTPTNYLELVAGYIKILEDKRNELGDQCDKLQGGLSKLEETKVSVQKMSEDLEQARVALQKAEADCDSLLTIITSEKRQADEKKTQVEADKVKIAREKEVATAIASEAQADLDKAMPELDAAQEALKTLKKADIDEIKAYKTPPEQIQTVLGAVQTVLKKPPTWDEAKKSMGDSNFLAGLMEYNKELLTDALLNKIGKYTAMPKFKPEIVGQVSNAARGLCMWCIAMHRFGLVQKEVMPKKMKLDKTREELARKEKMLAAAEEELRKTTEKVEALEKQTEEKLAEKQKLQEDAEATENKLKRAEEIVGGLGGEKDRWSESIKKYEAAILNLTGDSLLASAFVSYAGPFNSEYRQDLVNVTWMKEVRKLQIPVTRSFTANEFLAEPTEIRDWQLQGLPGDDFSVENGVLVNRGQRWPLMIDPQNQANKWIKNMEKSRGLKVLDLKMPDFLRSIEHAVQLGTPILMQDVLEEMDPSLDPILSKAVMKQGSRLVMKIGDNTVDYNENFRFYLTTKLANPHYSPEVCTKALVINFAVREDGLEDQLLKIVVRKEKAELEEQKDELVLNTAAAKKKTKELEDEILKILANSDETLLEDVNLVTTLKTSKETSIAIQKQLKDAEVSEAVTEEKINVAREAYRPCAKRAAILFFVLSDLGSIDTMYQFSLDSYVTLFTLSINKSSENIRTDSVQNRVKTLNDWHTLAVYNNTCRGLFEKHKLLFSFHMCARILQAKGELNTDEYCFLLKGGQVFDKEAQAPNPCPHWLSEKGWDNVYEADKLLAFHGISASFEQGPSQWHEVYLSPNPEDAVLPGDWNMKFDDLQRMIMIRCIRPDRVIFMVTRFIELHMDRKFVEPPSFNLQEIYDDSNPFQPLIFVLCPGVDPTTQLQALADKLGRNLKSLALGQGQAPLATRLMAEQAKTGGWVFLANCHLMLSWLPKLEKLIDDLPAQKPHDNFRIWLSSTPHEKFPIAILQQGIKMTTEPPTGLKSNLIRLYNLMTDQRFNHPKYPELYRPLLFSLCFYHSVLLERRKFGALGMAIPYDFNDSDWEVSENILQLYLDEMPDGSTASIPWDTIKYLIAEASYGGRVTDDWDRRTLGVYAAQYFHPDCVTISSHKLSTHEEYFIPSLDGTMISYKEYIMTLPVIDPPDAFGQHSNADIASQITNSMALLDTLITINSALLRAASVGGGGGGGGGGEGGDGGKGGAAANSVETRVFMMAQDLEERLPDKVDLEAVMESKVDEQSALLTVLLQELGRYNTLLAKVYESLSQLKKGVKGLVVMNDELEAIFGALLDGRVPKVWLKMYPSLKPLASWARDLIARVEQLSTWGMGSQPKTFWLSGFTYPTGFLKALQQQQARATKISIDKFGWEFHVLPSEMGTVTQSPKEGAYVRGIYLEGASWNDEKQCLQEPNPMELICGMPLIHFKPVELKKKGSKGMYVAPLYMYPIRTGSRERPSFVVGVDLNSGAPDASWWVKRGTALLLSTDT